MLRAGTPTKATGGENHQTLPAIDHVACVACVGASPAGCRTNGTSLDVSSDFATSSASLATSAPCRPAVPQPLKGQKKAKPWWRRAIRLVAFGDANLFRKTNYAYASVIRVRDSRALGILTWLLRCGVHHLWALRIVTADPD